MIITTGIKKKNTINKESVSSLVVGDEIPILVENSLQQNTSQSSQNKTISNEKEFHCDNCGMEFNDMSALSRHMKSHSDDREQHCNRVKPPASTMKRKNTTENGKRKEKTFICEQCGKEFNVSNAKAHMLRHIGKKSYPCKLCTKAYYSKSDLSVHIYTHTGEMPFPCEYCDRRFNNRSFLIRHTRTHTNERPFVCSYCGKGFFTANVHKDHLLTHTGERAFDCELCNVSFKRKTNLDSHNRTKSHKRNEGNQQDL